MHWRNVKQENAGKLAVHKYWRKENEDVSLTGGLAENSSLSESMSFSRAGPSLAAHAYTFPSSVTSDTSTCEWVGSYLLLGEQTYYREGARGAYAVQGCGSVPDPDIFQRIRILS